MTLRRILALSLALAASSALFARATASERVAPNEPAPAILPATCSDTHRANVTDTIATSADVQTTDYARTAQVASLAHEEIDKEDDLQAI